ncbi:MAG: hypothetical protein FJW20_11575 [Acidimicrobiia bacterium]|nr:hypothetical protein [Acidimicrobiia bacterium]
MGKYVLCFVGVFLVHGQVEDSSRLPVRRVVLYKNGVGYFEHLGQVRDRQDVSISFTSGQLNDVLKSLTVLDLGGGRITGVGYGTKDPQDRQMDALRLSVGSKASLTEILGALRGARVELTSGTATLRGRLLSVERKTRINGGTTLEVDYVSLLSDEGQVRTSELSPAFSFRLLDGELAGRVGKYLDLVASERDADSRRMVISTDGTGERRLFVSYISEVPVWKATYRIVLGAKPLLQGWAVVDNTVGQDWKQVELSLVAGAPQSFVQNLSQPYYARRPVVALPEHASSTPQTYETALRHGGRLSGKVTDPSGSGVPAASVRAVDGNGTVLSETTTDASGNYELEGIPEGGVDLRMEAPGFKSTRINGVHASARGGRYDHVLQIGNVSEAVTVTADVGTLQTQASTMAGGGRQLGTGAALGGRGFRPGSGGGIGGVIQVEQARNRTEAAAQGRELGDLFEYKLKAPVTIGKNQSALVPILQSDVSAEKVSVWNENSGLPRPQRALWLTNSTDTTLEGGSFSVLEEETFAGEGVFEPIAAGEKRLISYATDLPLHASSRTGSEAQQVTRVRVRHGTITHYRSIYEKKTYTFRNEDNSARTVIVEHPLRVGYQLKGSVKPVESTGGWQRFRLEAPAKQTASLVVEESRPLSADYALTSFHSGMLVLVTGLRRRSAELEAALEKLLAAKQELADLKSKLDLKEKEQEQIYEDQQRLRENMQSLKGSAEEKALLKRYTSQLDAQETKLHQLKQEIAELGGQVEVARERVNETISEMEFDVEV